MLDRDPPSHPQPASLSGVCSGGAGLLRGKKPSWDRRQTVGWGDGVRARPRWFKGQSVGYMYNF